MTIYVIIPAKGTKSILKNPPNPKGTANIGTIFWNKPPKGITYIDTKLNKSNEVEGSFIRNTIPLGNV
ncbi:MAG: hypothetical protein ACW99Q_22390 [Candidatus Kariarchaeaceae archaeon]|jgi:hypothetical protein